MASLLDILRPIPDKNTTSLPVAWKRDKERQRKTKLIIIKSNSQNDPPTHGAEMWKFKMIALFYEILINNAMRLYGSLYIVCKTYTLTHSTQ